MENPSWRQWRTRPNARMELYHCGGVVGASCLDCMRYNEYDVCMYVLFRIFEQVRSWLQLSLAMTCVQSRRVTRENSLSPLATKKFQTPLVPRQPFSPNVCIQQALYQSSQKKKKMSGCVVCQKPLEVEVERDDDEEYEGGASSSGKAPAAAPETYPDDVQLSCGCHFHW